jgi:hypothetical protein
MNDERHVPGYEATSAEAAAAGEDGTWETDQTVSADDTVRSFDDPEAEEDEEELT